MRTSSCGVISGPWSSRSRPVAAPSSVKGALGGMGLYQGGGGTSVRAGLVVEVLVVVPEAAARVEAGAAGVCRPGREGVPGEGKRQKARHVGLALDGVGW